MNKSRCLVIAFLFVSFALFSQGSLETVLQKGHELAVVSLAISPDSSFLVTGSKDKSVKLWQVETGREVRSFLGHEKTVNNVEFTPDGKSILSAGQDKTVKLWDVTNGK